MQKEQDRLKSDEDCPQKTRERKCTCDECGRTFQRPILATVSTGNRTQTYYACPRCMTKVQSFKPSSKENEEEAPVLTMEPRKLKPEPEGDVKCAHSFGYLNKRQKNTPFPDECLMCARMVECMRPLNTTATHHKSHQGTDTS